MRAVRPTLLVAALLVSLPAWAGAASEVPALIGQLVGGSDEARLKLIDLGLPAVPSLVQLMTTQTGRPAAEAERAVGWIVERAAGSPQTRARAAWMLVNLLVDARRPLPVRRMAAGLLWHVGGEGAVPTLAPLLAQRELRDSALWSLQHLPGPAAVAAMADASRRAPPEFHAAILRALATRSDRPVHLFLEAADDRSPIVRLAALDALGRVAAPAAASLLATRVESASGDERATALRAYIKTGGGFLAAGDRAGAGRVYRQALQRARDDAPAAAMALRGLARAAVSGTAEAAAPFLRSPNPTVQVAAAAALVRAPDSGATQALTSALPHATTSAAIAILTALADRADRAALPVLLPATRPGDLNVRVAALRALGAVGDPAAVPALTEVLAQPDSPSEASHAALAALLAIGEAQAGRGRAAEARATLEAALKGARTDADQAAALRGLAPVAGPASLAMVEPFLGREGEVRDAAVEAGLAASDAIAATGDRKAAIAAYLKLVDVVAPGAVADAVLARLGALGSSVDLGSRHGFITCWWVIGPFPSPGKSGYDRVFFPEQELDLKKEYDFEGRKLKWRFVHTLDPQGIVDFVALFDPHDHTGCYACAEVTVPQATDIRVRSASDDGVIVWLNGERIFGTNADRSLEVDMDNTEARLRAGTNTLLLKVLQGGGSWNACVRLTDRADKPIRFDQKCE